MLLICCHECGCLPKPERLCYVLAFPVRLSRIRLQSSLIARAYYRKGVFHICICSGSCAVTCASDAFVGGDGIVAHRGVPFGVKPAGGLTIVEVARIESRRICPRRLRCARLVASTGAMGRLGRNGVGRCRRLGQGSTVFVSCRTQVPDVVRGSELAGCPLVSGSVAL